MNSPKSDPSILEYARQRGIAVPPEKRIVSELQISEIISPQYQYSDEIAFGFKKFYSTARKDLEPQKLDLKHDSALLLVAQKKVTTESQVNWDNIIPSMNRVGTRPSDPPLQSEQAIREAQTILSRSEYGFDSTCLKSEHAQNAFQFIGFESYFAPLIAQRLGFSTVWGPPKNYDMPPRLSEVLAQAQDFSSVKLDLSKEARVLMSKDWRSSSKVVDSMHYEMFFQQKAAMLFHDIELVPEKIKLHNGQSIQIGSAARGQEIAQGRPPSDNTPFSNLQVPEEPAVTGPREYRQPLPSILEYMRAETQSEQFRDSPYVQSGSPNKDPDSAAESTLYKVQDTGVPPKSIRRSRLQPKNISQLTQIARDSLNANPLDNVTVSRPILVETYPELHKNGSSLHGSVLVKSRPIDGNIASSVSEKLIPFIWSPLPITEITYAAEWPDNDNGKSVQRTGLTDTPPIGKFSTPLQEGSCISSIGLLSTGLGSLSKFMETRGVVTTNGSATSAYFPAHETNKINEQKHRQNQHILLALGKANLKPSTNSYSLVTPAMIKSSLATMSSDLVLFLSIDLLKTHLQMIQSLEQQATPPRLIYREYKHLPVPTDLRKSHYQQTPPEADIIIAPAVGIILSSFHALTQTYLPGHTPEDPYIRINPDITSPLRERIFRLAPRYEILYVLISHSVEVLENISLAESLRMNNTTQESLHSLNLFCDSLSHTTAITPLQLPALQEHITACILTLTAKHTYFLPKICIPVPEPLPIIYANFRGHVTLSQLLKDDETKWEIFLRAIGLNPFAARTVLDVLDVDGYATTGAETEHQYFPVKELSVLANFIEMEPVMRVHRFRGLIGEGLWARLHDVIEVD